jgi:phage terminase large subunit-like protein
MIVNPIDKEQYPFCHAGFQYAIDVVCGDIPNCKYVIGACHRFLNDWDKSKLAVNYYFFDIEKAEGFLKKVQRFKHVIGDWSTEDNPDNRIIYLPWQHFVWMNIIGFRHRDNPRNPRFRVAHVEIPRGQAKSTMASQAALYFVGLDKPLLGNQISCFATKADQARIVLDAARAMANKSPDYLKNTGVVVQQHKIVHDESFSFVRFMAADSNGMDGLNDLLSIMDELHAMDRSLFEVVSSGMSKRRDSLMLCITTAGFNTDGVGYDQSVYAKKVAEGSHLDDQMFAIVYTIDDGDDIYSEESWRKANPSYGHSVDPITFKAKAEKAKITPADIPNFKVKHLNVWISEAKAYYSLDHWDKCADPTLKLEDFKGQKCFAAIDLASKIDITSLAYIFKKDEIYYLFDQSFIPEDRVKEVRSPLYDNCIASGHLIATPGEAIHYGRLRESFVAVSKTHKIMEAMYDPWNATSFAQDCKDDKIEMVEFRMNTSNLSEPTKNLDALIRQGKFRHNGSPLLRWCLGNVVCKEDNAGNVFPKKSNEKLKIDPIVATIMALARWMNEKEPESVYEKRGIRSV